MKMNKMTCEKSFKGKTIVGGSAEGRAVTSNMPLSFWGGFNPSEGKVIDRYHDLYDVDVRGKILVLPEGRGSCTGSVVLLEAILSENGPDGIILRAADEIITLGGIVADEIFNGGIPVVILDEEDFSHLINAEYININDGDVTVHFMEGDQDD